ncbi:MAG: DoxX family protein [Nitratireductor sp.]
MSNTHILLAARILLAIIFILAGAMKFGGIEGTAGYIASVRLPAATLLAWLAAIFRTGGRHCYPRRFPDPATFYLLAAFCVFTGFVFHFQPADQIQFTMFLKNLAIAGGFLALAVAGAGSLSVDSRRS